MIVRCIVIIYLYLSFTNGFCNEAFPTLEYNGNCYATLGGFDPYDTAIGCQSSYEVIPDGWAIAKASPDVYHVTSQNPWGTHVLVFYDSAGTGGEWLQTSTYSGSCGGCDIIQYQAPNMYKPSTCSLRILLIKVAYACECYTNTLCRDTSWAVYHNGLYWAWASPCSGECSQLPDPLPYGWRRATNEEFAAGYPSYDDFGQGSICAASIFDPVYDHCDAGDYSSGNIVNVDNGGSSETVIVHDSYECPTNNPTNLPSAAPTVSPTTCYDINGTYTNDGYETSVDQQISELSFSINTGKSIDVISTGQYFEESIKLNDDLMQELDCSEFGSCAQSHIIFTNNTICNLKCSQFFSCFGAIIDISKCEYTHIICNEKSACKSAQINLISENINDNISIDCGVATSCEDLYINITSNTRVDITCYDINACNRMEIDTKHAIINDANVYQNVYLHMLSYSENVLFFNGFGYEEIDGSHQYVTCGIDNQFIKYPTNPRNQTAGILTNLVNNEYKDQKFPCEGVQIGCFQPNSSDTSSCDMQSSIGSTDFSINSPDPLASCYWVPVSSITRISCAGMCASSPTRDPTPAPTHAPSFPTGSPTSDPTYDPTQDPTIDPTIDPTMEPTVNPTMVPTLEPTAQPTYDPTIDPTRDPTADPTNDPTIEPTSAPTNTPTQPPTTAPSVSPSAVPSQPPTGAPTRGPTLDVDDIYDTKIDIAYYCYNLTKTNKEFIVHNTNLFVAKFQEIAERNYFDEENGLYFKDFWVQVTKINGKSILSTEGISNQRRLADSLLTLYDLDILGNSPMILTAKIECADDDGEILIKKSESNTFRLGVQQELSMILLNNTQGIYFKVQPLGADELYEQEKFPATEPEEAEGLLIIWLSVMIISIGLIITIGAFVFNKLKSSKVDNARYAAPLLIALAMYDFMSDINLAIQIFQNEDTVIDMKNINFLLGIASIIFIILPFISNLWYAMRINSEETIQYSPSARAWFGNHLPQFILLCIACAGTYPALGLTSSRIFGVDFFNAGLLSSELHELSKIKIRSTIFMENLPQLMIQVIYSYSINKLENATILAFIASFLSIIASLVIYYAQKEQNEKFLVMRYFLRLQANQNIDVQSRGNINRHKGLKEKLRNSLCNVFGISQKSIEIGFITEEIDGCRIHLQHSIFKSEMDKLKRKMLKDDNQNYLNATPGFKIEITEDMYIKQVVKDKREELLTAILNHFGLNSNDNIEMKYRLIYQSGDEYDDEVDNEDNNQAMSINMDKMASNIKVQLSGNADYHNLSTNDGEAIEMAEIVQNNNNDNSFRKMMEMQQKMATEMQLLKSLILANGNGNLRMDINDNMEEVYGDGLETAKSTEL